MTRKLNPNEYKKKLEHQIYLAQEHPAPIYDLSDCNITQIPRGVFTFCKVLRKYSLNLSENNLNSLESGGNLDDLSLLGELILTNNKFKSLSSSFNKLCNLQKLIMDDNKLQKFPTVLIELENLKLLSLEGNFINNIPKEVCRFKSLKFFNISRNPIKYLSSEICEIESLEEFYIDINNIKDIPADIKSQGMDKIWRFFCQVSNKKYRELNFNQKFVHENLLTSNNDGISYNKEKKNFSYLSKTNHFNFRNHEMDNEVLEHERKLSMLELEDKRKNVDLIKKNNELEEKAIKTYLMKKKNETDRLFDRIKYEELSSNELMESIFDYNYKSKKREELEKKITSDSYFNYQTLNYETKLNEYEKDHVLESMNQTLQRASTVVEINNSFPNSSLFNDNYPFNDYDYHPLDYVDQLKETEHQKLAFQQFQLEKDPQMKRLQESICLIELKLKQLSAQEINYSQLIDSDPNSRADLISLLQKFRDEQSEREQDLKKQIEAMDNNRDLKQNDFWIIQYQRLLDEKAKSDYEIEQLLNLANVGQWTLALRKYDYTFEMLLNISEKELIKMELGNEYERKHFLLFLNEWKFNPIKSSVETGASAPSEQYLSLGKMSANPTIPSAPPLQHSLSNKSNMSDEAAVVLARKETECCICLNLEAMILLLNCGHVCCCKQCSLTVKDCPLCRQKIVQRVNLEFDV